MSSRYSLVFADSRHFLWSLFEADRSSLREATIFESLRMDMRTNAEFWHDVMGESDDDGDVFEGFSALDHTKVYRLAKFGCHSLNTHTECRGKK